MSKFPETERSMLSAPPAPPIAPSPSPGLYLTVDKRLKTYRPARIIPQRIIIIGDPID